MKTDSPQPALGRAGLRRLRKRRRRQKLFIIIGSIVAILAIGAGAAYAFLVNSFDEVQRVSIEQDPSLIRPDAVAVDTDNLAPVNILLLGSDSRGAVNANTNSGDLSGSRSDAILVAQISADRENVTVMSIMRDNWVEIQGHGHGKINSALANGGLPLAVNTVENLIGARIDHVALIDFQSFKGLSTLR